MRSTAGKRVCNMQMDSRYQNRRVACRNVVAAAESAKTIQRILISSACRHSCNQKNKVVKSKEKKMTTVF